MSKQLSFKTIEEAPVTYKPLPNGDTEGTLETPEGATLKAYIIKGQDGPPSWYDEDVYNWAMANLDKNLE
jgi:hypothetical protein